MGDNMRVIYQKDSHRIIEEHDEDSTFEDLAGDSFKSGCNPTVMIELLLDDAKEFRERIETEGVFGYVLEKWNPDIDRGWEHVDSCFGFVGRYDEDKNNHCLIKSNSDGSLGLQLGFPGCPGLY